MPVNRQRDMDIAKLVFDMQLEIVEACDIPKNAEIEGTESTPATGGPILLEYAGRNIEGETNYFSFTCREERFTAAQTFIRRLSKVTLDNGVGDGGVSYSGRVEDITKEVHRWAHQVELEPFNELGFNYLVHACVFTGSGWDIEHYVMELDIPEMLRSKLNDE